MIVCHCYQVTDRRIKECIKNDLDPIKETKAGTGCKGCRPELNKLIRESKLIKFNIKSC